MISDSTLSAARVAPPSAPCEDSAGVLAPREAPAVLSWPPKYEDLLAAIAREETQLGIARRYGMSRQALQHIIRKYGIAWPFGKGGRPQHKIPKEQLMVN